MTIRQCSEITTEWLGSVLHDSGHLKSGSVEGVGVTPDAFSGNVAHLASLTVTYSDDAKGRLPTQLFLKVSKQDLHEEHLALGRKEVEFYTSTMSRGLSIPVCYDAVCDPETGHSHILMDDLSPTHFQLTPPIPPSPEHCGMVVDSLALIHGWENPDLGVTIGQPFDPTKSDTVRQRLEATFPAFMDFLGSSLLPRQRKMYQKILQSNVLSRFDSRLRQIKNTTLVHGDAHVGNFMLPHDLESGQAVAIDWHLWEIFIGASDLAFFIAHKWSPARRGELEKPLLERYHRTLVGAGVAGYTWDDLWQDYRQSVILATLISIGQFRRKQHPGIVWNGLECSSAAYEDLGCEELL
jgi:hypothetical protein